MEINFKEILKYAEMAAAAYKPDKEIKALYPDASISGSLSARGLKAFVVKDDEHQVYWISCRGTANFTDLKLDAEYKKHFSTTLGIPIHAGFFEAAKTTFKYVLPELRNTGYKIRITGHSLGGAIAVVLMMLLKPYRTVDKVITYGQPKVCTKKGAIKYGNEPLLRIVNDEDPIPLLPPTTLYSFFDYGLYRHFRDEIRLLEGKSFEYMDGEQAQKLTMESFWLRLGREDLSDHFMDAYLQNIKDQS